MFKYDTLKERKKSIKNKLKKLIKNATKNMRFKRKDIKYFYENSKNVLKDLQKYEIQELKVLVENGVMVLLVVFQVWTINYAWKYTF